MSATMLDYTVNELARMSPRWDEMIAADLVSEVKTTPAASVSDMRLALAIKGYREIYEILTAETSGKPAVASLRVMALALRRFWAGAQLSMCQSQSI